MKKKFPIICPANAQVFISQGFCPPNNPSHDACDFILWSPKMTTNEWKRLSYGSQLVCPVKEAKVVLTNDFGSMNPKGNGVDIEWQEDGYYWRLHFWHNVFNNVKLGDTVKEGQIVGLMGNTGDVRENGVPMPTPENPFGGVHCHCRFSRYKKNPYGGNIEIESLDMRNYFDVNNPYCGVDSSVVVDLEPLYWAWLKLGIKTNAEKLKYLLMRIFN